MGFLSRIGGLVSKASGFLSKVSSFIKSPAESITKLVSPMIDKIATKLPFGLGPLVAPFAKKFLGAAIGWLSKGPLAGVFGLLQKIAPTVEKLSGFLKSADKLLNGGLKSLPQPAKDNVANLAAYNHARAIGN